MITLAEFEELLRSPSEHEHLEFKEARGQFDLHKLAEYCCALANEGGGRIILGVSDRLPRKVTGTQAFPLLDKTKHQLLVETHLRIDVEELDHPGGRVLIFEAPPRSRGQVIAFKGRYRMRSGESLVDMTQERLREIMAEYQPDFSAEICRGAAFADLDPSAIARFKSGWQRRRGEDLTGSDQQILEDAELMVDGHVTNAALILLGTERALGRRLANAEVIFEYRGVDEVIESEHRREFRRAFLLELDVIWSLINLRNPEHPYQDGLFRGVVRAFNESAVREAVLNAISHRDYRDGGSIFIRQSPTRLVVTSPGGFPQGITAENIIDRQCPRNRRLAEALQRCGLVERSGQGADRMYSAAIREGKLPPDFSRSDEYQVELELHGRVRNPAFIRFLVEVSEKRGAGFDVRDLLLLDTIDRGLAVPAALKARAAALLDAGAIERRARGQYILGARFHDGSGASTRRRGLDHATNQELLLRHIRRNAATGTPFHELEEVLPALTRNVIRGLVRGLKDRGEIRVVGERRAARWFPGPSSREKSQSIT